MRELLKPEYLWRPSQLLRRLSFRPDDEYRPLPLPWNSTIRACPAEDIGRAIAKQGVYDLPVTEAIMRLAEAGETSLDVGANIGYMTLVLALSVCPRGRVLSFEPNPDVLQLLRTNVSTWTSPQIAPIEIHTVALSDRDGEGRLGFPVDYRQNTGVASLEAEDGHIPVMLGRLREAVQER